jgi:phage shock protein E
MKIFSRFQRSSFVVLFLAASLVFVGCGAADEEASDQANEEKSVQEISQQDLLSNPPRDALILDVRTPGEFGEGHVPNAVNIPHNELASRLSELNSSSDRPIVLYCKSGRRAGMAAEVLQRAGYTDLHHLTGDMNAWMAAGLPTE